MKSEAVTVAQYLRELPEDRRAIISPLRDLILKNLPKGYVEAMNWGMISYEVPLAVVPDTYNGQPLMYAALAAQKRHNAIYLMSLYEDGAVKAKLEARFRAAVRKVDCGKCCVRFRKVADLDLDAVAEAVRATPMNEFIARYRATRGK